MIHKIFQKFWSQKLADSKESKANVSTSKMVSSSEVLFSSKKGIVGMSLQQTIGLILAIMFIILSVVVIMGLINVFTAGPDEGSTARFNEIFDAVELMLSDANTNLSESCKIKNMYIHPGFAIVGFNKKGMPNEAGEYGKEGDENYGFVEEHCPPDPPNLLRNYMWDDIYKPKSCLDRGCLCLCPASGDVDGDDCKDSGAQCRRLNAGFQNFIMTNPEKNNMKIDLVIYGESCLGSNLNVIPGYVIKLHTKTMIEVNPILDIKVFQKDYAGILECKDLITKLRKPAVAVPKPADNKPKPEEDTLNKAVKEHGGITPGTLTPQ